MNFNGRKKITSGVDRVTASNVIDVLADALSIHLANKMDIEYLYNYYKGQHPVLNRTKERNDFVNNKIVENRAYEIVKFVTGYRVGNPIQYVSRKADSVITDDVTALNDILYEKSKAKKDIELVQWQSICGTAYRIVLPLDEVTLITADPRRTFVIYSADVFSRPLAGVYYTEDSEGNVTFTIYTDTEVIVVYNTDVVSVEPHLLGAIPIIEYPSSEDRLGVFEPVLPLLDAIDTVDSNRIDGIEQYIQNLLVLYGVDIPKDETASTMRKKGVLVLPSQDGAGGKVDVKMLSEQLNQSDTQTVKDDMYQSVLRIVGMPSMSNGNSSESSNNGAVMYKNGWSQAEARAQEFERMFDEPEMTTVKLILSYLDRTTDIHLKGRDIQVKFTRRNYEDIVSKATVLTTLLNNPYVARIDAFTVCGLFPDPEESCRRGLEFYDESTTESTGSAPVVVRSYTRNPENNESVSV